MSLFSPGLVCIPLICINHASLLSASDKYIYIFARLHIICISSRPLWHSLYAGSFAYRSPYLHGAVLFCISYSPFVYRYVLINKVLVCSGAWCSFACRAPHLRVVLLICIQHSFPRGFSRICIPLPGHLHISPSSFTCHARAH